MRLVLPLIIISFLLDGLLSNFISLSSHIFNPLCTLVSLVLVYPFFKKNNNSYLNTAILISLDLLMSKYLKKNTSYLNLIENHDLYEYELVRIFKAEQ